MRISFMIVMLLCMTVSSCRTIRQVAERKVIPPISENKLIKNIEDNELQYNTLYAKRIDISLTDKKETNSFRASLKIRKDDFIQVSVTAPLGIEVARILLTPDSIKFADIYHKKYFLADYNYFYDKFDAHISFDCVQKILTNTFFNIEDCAEGGKVKKYKLDRTDQGYELSSVEEKTLSRKIKKLYKKKRKNKDFILILQKILIDPANFRPLSLSVEDLEEDMGVGVSYKNIKEFAGKIFPEKILFELFSEQSKTILEIKFLRLEFDTPVEPNFKISSKYKRMN